MRVYDINGTKLPSVTSVLSRTDPIFNPSKEAGLEWWRSKEPDHRRILDEACRRGSIIHSEVEMALTGRQSVEYTMDEWMEYNIPGYMTRLLPLLQTMRDGDVEVEKVVSHAAGYAGTADLICELEGKRTIVDWKSTRRGKDTGNKQKKRSHYTSAEIQIAAYADAYSSDERNPEIEQGLIVVAYDWKEPDLFLLDADDLCRRAAEFHERLEVFKILEAD